MTVDPACSGEFPPAFRRRTYDVVITPEPTLSRVRFDNPDVFPAPSLACICGWIRDGRLQLDLTFYEGTASFIVVYLFRGDVVLEGQRLIQTAGSASFNSDETGPSECISGSHEAVFEPRTP